MHQHPHVHCILGSLTENLEKKLALVLHFKVGWGSENKLKITKTNLCSRMCLGCENRELLVYVRTLSQTHKFESMIN